MHVEVDIKGCDCNTFHQNNGIFYPSLTEKIVKSQTLSCPFLDVAMLYVVKINLKKIFAIKDLRPPWPKF